MNRSTLRTRFGGIVLLLGFSLVCAGSGAASETVAPTPIVREQGHFLDVPALLENRAETRTSPLLAGVKAPRLEPQTSQPGYHLSSANLVRDNNEPGGFIVIVNKDDGSFLALVNGPNRSGLVLGQADGSQTFNEDTKTDFLKDDSVFDPQEQARADALKEPLDSRSGELQITVLMGYSRAAADYVSDTTAYTLAQLETVNLGLRNSGVTGIRLVVGEIAVTQKNYPQTTETLSSLPSIFANYSRSSLVAGFFMPTDQDGGIGGMAWTPGRYSINHVTGGIVFRHEVAHGAGGSHCNGGDKSYRYGYSDGKYSTILCGNNVPYYSTPNRSINGSPLGNANTADMARVWREQAHRLASYEESSPFLIQSMAGSAECVDSHGQSAGTKVGLWVCDKNNPNQQWVQVQVGNKILIRLKAYPTLCLSKGHDGSTRDVLLLQCHEGFAWEEVTGQFKTLGLQNFLYLSRKSDGTLEAAENGGSQPGSHWKKLPVAQTPPFLLHSVAAPSQCVDAHGYTGGAKVGLWGCDKNNPNQQWERVQAGNKVMIRLKSVPALCLSKGDQGSIRDLVLRVCSEGYAWEQVTDQLRTPGDKEFLYLNRTSSNALEASEKSNHLPGSHWRMENLPTP
ncbi:ricin-type beta-trefoil lectin domain protein [Pseudomonas sp. Marseille-P9899]|uniref:ricin-type beta-trefoil lectin domain protein n=1 Tax=Pseudomonas sp. Marseille-P9899 TaxID=2730401 RepID=UPI00158E4FC0|nr:ricin-type beta-trefoil lectin domain protein [Pseudomonas sp. Marseille-P9899]